MFRIEKKSNCKEVYLFGKKIFSINKYSNATLLKKIDSLQSVLQFTFNIKDMQKARGTLRDIQLAELKILKEIKRVCSEQSIIWWIDFGTLLGAVRHKGFIPWDDDIDICMMRDYYEKFIDIFNQNTIDKQLKAEIYVSDNGIYNMIKVSHKSISNLFVDIFPVDLCYRKMDDCEKLNFSKQLQKLVLQNAKLRKKTTAVEFSNKIKQIQKQLIPDMQPNSQVTEPTVFYGLEYYHSTHPYNAFDYDTVFPLQNIEFEGDLFPTVAREDLYLTYIFGDYMQLPKILHIHTNMQKMSVDNIIKIKKYISE